MLTFEFTGVAGSMTEKERITSGMVGKEVLIRLSSEWTGLNCTVVFVAGDICRTAAYRSGGVAIPEDILRYPFRRLQVGVWGANGDGTLVIPTILAEGPFVELGANPYADPVAVEVPVWQQLQEQVGNLSSLTTAAKTSLVAAINELARKPQGGAPVRGVDYWTEADIAEIKSYVYEAILGGAW